jgi:beta-lactam-binding protein with PASTA domain
MVMFKSVREAIRILQQAGLQATGDTDNPRHLVIGQDPGVRAKVKPGASIRLTAPF